MTGDYHTKEVIREIMFIGKLIIDSILIETLWWYVHIQRVKEKKLYPKKKKVKKNWNDGTVPATKESNIREVDLENK